MDSELPLYTSNGVFSSIIAPYVMKVISDFSCNIDVFNVSRSPGRWQHLAFPLTSSDKTTKKQKQYFPGNWVSASCVNIDSSLEVWGMVIGCLLSLITAKYPGSVSGSRHVRI